MALVFKWDPIAFRKATRGWRPTAVAVYRQIIDDLHLNDGSLSETFLFDLWRDHHYDRRTWVKWVQFLIDTGKLRKNAKGEYINTRVAADHARITKRERDMVVTQPEHGRDTLVQKPRKNAKQYSAKSNGSEPPLQDTGYRIQEEEKDSLSESPKRSSELPFEDPFSTPPKSTNGAAAKSTEPKPDPRGHRLPDDWKPPAELCEFGVDLGLTVQQVKTEIDRFRDYWHAKAGAAARKVDWDRTWKNWLRRAAEGPP